MTHSQRLISTIKAKTGLSSYHIGIKTGNEGQVSRWERGIIGMKYNEAHNICEKLELNLADLLLEMSTSKECQRLTNQQKELTSKEETK